MNDLLPLTQFIYSCWLLSDTENTALPTAPGVLDHALYALKTDGVLPNWVDEQLHFVDGASGLTCLELPQIQALAMEAKLTEEPNPSYVRSEVVMSPLLARRCLAQLRIPELDARACGSALRNQAREAEARLETAQA